jgi:hypothetical protein
MKVLAIGRPVPGVDAAAEIPRYARDELTDLWRLYRDGVVREMYSPGGPGAVLILECADLDAARAAVDAFPLAANGIIQFELIELRPFSAIEMLFSA